MRPSFTPRGYSQFFLGLPQNLLLQLRLVLTKLNALIPGICVLCGTTGAHTICPGCRTQFFGEIGLRCRCCALPMSQMSVLPTNEKTTSICRTCLHRPPAFDATIVACDYAAPVDQLVLKLKFAGAIALAPLFADRIIEALLHNAAADMPLPGCLTVVPLGRKRLQERGFNQSLEIAKPLALALGVPLVPRMLARVRDTVAQSLLSSSERQRNLVGAFTLLPQTIACVRGAHIGVVDDVMTTGETLNEIAATLKFFGAARVTNLVFARTV